MVTENTTSSTVLNVEKEPVAPDPFTLEELLQAQKEDKLCWARDKSMRDP